MSIYQLTLLFFASVAAAINWGNWRAIGWLAAGQLSIILSVAYWKSGLPYGEGVAGICDAVVAYLVLRLGIHKWEDWVGYGFLLMLAVNIAYLASNIFLPLSVPHWLYASGLEVVNAIIIIFIGGIGVLGWVDQGRIAGPADGRLVRAGRVLLREKAPTRH